MTAGKGSMADAIVLIVDDDRTIVRLCQRLLERASYQVITAINPSEILDILGRQKINLLLTDIRMPGMDGFELISQAKKLQPDLPVLVMTGYGNVDDALQALHRGVDGLILKPFENSTDLVNTVRQILEQTEQRRDSARLHVLRPLFDVTERLLSETSPEPLEKLILNTITTLFQASNAWIYRLDPDGSGFDLVRTTEATQAILNLVRQHRFFKIADGNSPPALYNVSTKSGSAESAEIWQMLSLLDWEAMMVVPVRRDKSQFIFCADREKGSIPFTEADLEQFVILARQAAVAMENARLYSELKAYVKQVEESQMALVQAEKMAAMGRLMATVAHEINNPLQSVRNCLHLAVRDDISADQRLKYIQMTGDELERLSTTVQQMLDYYRPGGLEKRFADLRLMIDQVLALLEPQLNEQHIAVHVKYQGVVVPVLIVTDQMKQVIINLLLNAADALEEWTNRSSQEKEIWVDIYYEKSQVRILIEDSGPGIPIEMREHIFEPFVSTKQQGTGLGLAVSYGIIERHQGQLTVIPPRYKNGACFEIVLPNEVEGENGKNIDRG